MFPSFLKLCLFTGLRSNITKPKPRLLRVNTITTSASKASPMFLGLSSHLHKLRTLLLLHHPTSSTLTPWKYLSCCVPPNHNSSPLSCQPVKGGSKFNDVSVVLRTNNGRRVVETHEEGKRLLCTGLERDGRQEETTCSVCSLFIQSS